MSNDLLHVGEQLCRVDGSIPFDPLELTKNISLSDFRLGLNWKSRVVAESDPCLKEEGALIKGIGSGEFYLFVGRDGTY